MSITLPPQPHPPPHATRTAVNWFMCGKLGGSRVGGGLGLLVGCLASQQHASVSLGRICSNKFMRCCTEIEVADQTFYLTQSQSTDTRLTSPSAGPITAGACQGSHWSTSHCYGSVGKNPHAISRIGTPDLPLSRGKWRLCSKCDWKPLPFQRCSTVFIQRMILVHCCLSALVLLFFLLSTWFFSPFTYILSPQFPCGTRDCILWEVHSQFSQPHCTSCCGLGHLWLLLSLELQ